MAHIQNCLLVCHPMLLLIITELGVSHYVHEYDNLLIIFPVIPWGRFGPLRADLEQASKSEEDGGTGIAKKFWEWSEAQVKSYL